MFLNSLFETFKTGVTIRKEQAIAFSKLIALLFLVSLITVMIHEQGWLSSLETPVLDMALRLYPLPPENTFVVGITDADYRHLFKSTSPLDAKQVYQLVSRIAKAGPKVVVVDIDTESPEFQKYSFDQFDTKIVWARNVESPASAFTDQSANEIVTPTKQHPAATIKGELAPLLGRAGLNQNSTWGLSVFPQDDDGLVRHYYRMVSLKTGSRTLSVPCLPWAAVMAYRNQTTDLTEPQKEMVLSLVGLDQLIPRLSASDLTALSETSGWKEIAAGKIVLLGGYYGDARDTYATPLGTKAGVELVASAIESELQRGGIRPVSPTHLFLVLLVGSMLLVPVNLFLSRSWAPLVALIIVPLLAVPYSILFFATASLWIDFVPVLIAVQSYYLYRHISAIRRQNLDLQSTTEELRKAQNELAVAVHRGAERERKRLSHELHDDILGQLSEVSLRLDASVDRADHSEVLKASSTVRNAIDGMREIIAGLYPSVLDRYGFTNAVRDLLARRVGENLEFEIEDHAEKLADTFSRETQLALYRIVQECLNNTTKYAQASKIRIIMERDSEYFLLTFMDDGKGLPAESISDRFGMDSMKSRSSMLGATIEFHSPPRAAASGTEICLRVPLPRLACSGGTAPEQTSRE